MLLTINLSIKNNAAHVILISHLFDYTDHMRNICAALTIKNTQ